MTKSEELIRICNLVSEDMKNDAKDFDGKPFNGTTVATYFGNQGAAISALANVLRAFIETQINNPTPSKTIAPDSVSNDVG